MWANGQPERVAWEVLWVSKGKRQRKDFGSDFPEALRVYVIACKLDKPHATLRAKNLAFPPPTKYIDREEVVVMRGGKRYKGKKVTDPPQYQHTMHALNVKGVWWCPFCISLRRFVKREHFMLEGIQVNDPAMVCPICEVTHEHAAVAHYNPIAARYGAIRRTRSDKGATRE